MKNVNTWSLFKTYRWRLNSIVLGNILSNIPRGMFQGLAYFVILQLSIPIITNTQHDFQLLWRLCLVYAAAFVLYILLSMATLTNSFYQAYHISANLRLDLGEKLRRLTLGFFKQNDPGDVTSRMLHDVNKAEQIVSHSVPDIVSAFIVPVMLGVFLLVMNPLPSLVLFASVLVGSVFFFISRKVISVLGKQHIAAITETSSRILEYSRSIKLLKAYDMTGEGFQKLDESMKRLKKLSFRSEVFAGIPAQMFLFVLDCGYFVMLLVSIQMSLTGSLSIPELFSFIVLGYYFFMPVKQLGVMLVELRYAGLSVSRIGEILETEEPEYDSQTQLPETFNFALEDVYFRYKDEDVLKGVSCDIPENSMTALVGLSGSGKTTLTNLLARFWEINRGVIKFNGIPLDQFNPDILLTQIAMVFQDVYLFNDTIANNIRIGNPNATIEEIKEAAKLACCDEFVQELPDGYDTIVSESGSSLSGGEKQRISIARAILKNAPVILLDEATASLDPENEADIQQALENLVKGKTLVIIAHQFRSIQNADQILVMEDGKIAEVGQHDELVQNGGLYQDLWVRQQKAGSWKIKLDSIDVEMN